MNNEEQIFINQLHIFANKEDVIIYLDLCNNILIKNNLFWESKSLKFAALEGEKLGLSLMIGNRKIIGIYREKNKLTIGLILPSEKMKIYLEHPSFIKKYDFSNQKNIENEPKFISFDFLLVQKNTTQNSFWENILKDNQECIEKELEKNYHAKSKNKQNYYFWKACAEIDYRNQLLATISIDANNIRQYEERNNEIEEDDEDYDYSFDPSRVDITTEQRSLDSLISRLKYDGIDMNPDFQRNNNLWSNENMGRLIESILLRLPLPAFYFDASDNENWLVVDGLQRLSTIQKFVVYADKEHKEYDNRLILNKLKILKDVSGDYNALSGTYKRRIAETQITVYLIKPATPIEVKYSIFHRINTGGLKLNAQEIRNSLNQKEKKGTEFLKKLSEESAFKNIVRVSDKRMQDKEIILRFLAFQIMETYDYKGSLGIFLDQTLAKLNTLEQKKYDELKDKFIKALQITENIFEEKSFSTNLNEDEKSTFNRALYDVVMYYFAQIDINQKENIIQQKENIIEDFVALFNDNDFNESITSSTGSIVKVNLRFQKIYDTLKKYYPPLKLWKNDKNTQN